MYSNMMLITIIGHQGSHSFLIAEWIIDAGDYILGVGKTVVVNMAIFFF